MLVRFWVPICAHVFMRVHSLMPVCIERLKGPC